MMGQNNWISKLWVIYQKIIFSIPDFTWSWVYINSTVRGDWAKSKSRLLNLSFRLRSMTDRASLQVSITNQHCQSWRSRVIGDWAKSKPRFTGTNWAESKSRLLNLSFWLRSMTDRASLQVSITNQHCQSWRSKVKGDWAESKPPDWMGRTVCSRSHRIANLSFRLRSMTDRASLQHNTTN